MKNLVLRAPHFLVEERRRTADEKTRQSNRLTAYWKLYFPQILHWFDDVTTPLAGDLLERWPTLEQRQRAHPGTLRRFFREHNCRSEEHASTYRRHLPSHTGDRGSGGAGGGDDGDARIGGAAGSSAPQHRRVR
jgi:hypothetical protein